MGFRRVLPFVLVSLVLLVEGRKALAQVWLPGKGKATFAISYQWLDAKDHVIDSTGLTPFEEWVGLNWDTNQLGDFGRVSSMTVILDADVGVTDRLSLSGGVAFVAPRYLGEFPDSPTDDGHFHGAVQDARIGARYAAFDDGTWSVTPFTAFVFPATDYAVFGHTAPGLGLNELQVGASVGRLLDIGGSPRAWIQGAYFYSFMENVSEEITLDRSNMILEAGYFLSERLSASLLTSWQKVHGGIEWKDISHPTLSVFELIEHPHADEHFHAHDRAAATHQWRWGGGVSFQLTDRVELYGSVNKFLWGVNTHNATTINFGMNLGFQLWGGGGLGMWEARDDENSDLDDWLLEEIAGDGDDEKKKDGESSLEGGRS